MPEAMRLRGRGSQCLFIKAGGICVWVLFGCLPGRDGNRVRMRIAARLRAGMNANVNARCECRAGQSKGRATKCEWK